MSDSEFREMESPQDIIRIVQWGGGNYYLEDVTRGKTVRITPDTFWKIVEWATHYVNDIKLNEDVNR